MNAIRCGYLCLGSLLSLLLLLYYAHGAKARMERWIQEGLDQMDEEGRK